MQLTQLHNKNYTKFIETYQLALPLNLEVLIPEDDSVRLLSHVLEGLDYTKLYQAYYPLEETSSAAKDHVQSHYLCIFSKYIF